MSYQVIARKFRPQNFEQIIGQNHISTTLQNALANNRLPHALLFTGPRGTGKTSSARILAKALRCPNAKNFVPCNQCFDCEEIVSSRSPNVIEIDGASNNGVDAIRELRESVIFAPSSGKYKVYIIDEVHMLSTSAFNALLKTLEEPPEHVIFIMATTEVHKIPQTILSRCQRFDFRRISTRQITDHLKNICQQENIQTDDDSLWMIARQGDGSMRDSQSLLDQVITFANGTLNVNSVIDILGLTDHTLLLNTLMALVSRNQLEIISNIEKINKAGYEPHLFINDLLENIRNLLVIKLTPENTNSFLELPDSEIRFLNDLAVHTTQEDIHLIFDMLLKGAQDIPRSSEPRIVLEMILLRIVVAPQVMDLQSLLKSPSGVAQNIQMQKAQPSRTVENPALIKSGQHQQSPTTKKNLIDEPLKTISLSKKPHEKWYEIVQLIRQRDSLLAAKIENLIFNNEKEGKVLDFIIPAKMSFLKAQLSDRDAQEKLKGFIDQFWGPGYSFELRVVQENSTESHSGVSAKTIEQQKAETKKQNMTERINAHPKMKAASEIFKGQIKSIKEKT